MYTISLGELLPEVLSGDKTVTRRLCKASDPENGATCRFGRPGDLLQVDGAAVQLRVLSVTCEHLNDISDADVTLEGFASRRAFRVCWDNLFYCSGSGWDANPAVWRIEFEVQK